MRHFIIPLRGEGIVRRLFEALNFAGEGEDALQGVVINGEPREGIECDRHHIERLQSMSLLTRNFEAWEQDDIGQWSKLHPVKRPKLLIHGLDRMGRVAPRGRLRRVNGPLRRDRAPAAHRRPL